MEGPGFFAGPESAMMCALSANNILLERTMGSERHRCRRAFLNQTPRPGLPMEEGNVVGRRAHRMTNEGRIAPSTAGVTCWG